MQFQHLFGALALLAVLQAVTWATTVDKTLEPGAIGSAVVEATIDKIRSTCIFGDDKLFLRRLAYLMTQDGHDLNSARNGGIWGIPVQHFNSTQGNNPFTINIEKQFNIDWNLVSYTDLQKPLYSALAAMLVVFNNRNKISRDVADQVKLWQDIFDSKGTKEVFVRTANLLDQGCYYKSKMDTIFLLDGSGSVSRENFDKMTDFVQTIIDGYEVGANASQFGIVVFSNQAKTEVSLRNGLSKEELLAKTKQVKYPGGGTETSKGLEVIRNMFKTQGRADVPRIAFVVTDGMSNSMRQTLARAEALKNERVTVFSIGVGASTNTAELKGIASPPSCTHVFDLNDFSEFSAFRSELSKEACEAPIFLPPGTVVPVNLLPGVVQKCSFEITGEEATVKIRVDQGHITYLLSSEGYPNEAKYHLRIAASAGEVKLLTNVTKGSGNPTRYCAIVGDSLRPAEASISVLPGRHDACSQNPCIQPNTRCVPLENGRQCQCVPGYTGVNCQIPPSVADPKVSPDLPDAPCVKIPLTPEGVTITSTCKGAVYTSKDTCPTKDVHGTVTHVSEGSDSKVYVRPADQENAVYLMPEYPDGNCDNDTVGLGAPTIVPPGGTDRHHLEERQFLIKLPSLGATVKFTTDMGNATLYANYDEFPTQDSFTWATSAQPGQDGALYFPRKQSRNTEEFVYCLGEAPMGATIYISVQAGDAIPCRSSPCHNGATCIDQIGNYLCNCRKGFIGSNCETNTVRIRGDGISGVIEVFNNNFWGPICYNSDWNDVSAKVACQQLQLTGGAAGQQTESVRIFHSGFRCKGQETNINQCSAISPTTAQCSDVAVLSCEKIPTTIVTSTVATTTVRIPGPTGDTIGACASNPCGAPSTICKSFPNGCHLCGCPDGYHGLNCDEAPFFADAAPSTSAQGPLYDSQTEYVRFIVPVTSEGSTVTLDCESCNVFLSRKVYATESLYDSSYTIRPGSPHEIFLSGGNSTTWYFITIKIISSNVSLLSPVAVVTSGAPTTIASAKYKYVTMTVFGSPDVLAVMIPPANGFVIRYSATSDIEMYVGTTGFPDSTSYNWSASGREGQLTLSATQYPDTNYIYYHFVSQAPLTEVALSVLAKGTSGNSSFTCGP